MAIEAFPFAHKRKPVGKKTSDGRNWWKTQSTFGLIGFTYLSLWHASKACNQQFGLGFFLTDGIVTCVTAEVFRDPIYFVCLVFTYATVFGDKRTLLHKPFMHDCLCTNSQGFIHHGCTVRVLRLVHVLIRRPYVKFSHYFPLM